jgi:hypothetical protein
MRGFVAVAAEVVPATSIILLVIVGLEVLCYDALGIEVEAVAEVVGVLRMEPPPAAAAVAAVS